MKPIIFIDPGHSDRDPGAVGYETEVKLAEAVSKHMAAYLKANYECEVYVCPSNIDSLAEVCRLANDMGAALFVSNHFNAGGGDGFEVYVYSESRIALGKLFADRVKAIGQNLRSSATPGVKVRQLYVLANTTMPAVLTEGAFVDNKKDIQDWNDDAELKKLGEAYAKAAVDFVKPAKKETKPEAVKPAATVSIALPVLSTGSKGETVRVVQRILYSMGYDITKADGIFGPNTDSCVRMFQDANNLTPDGIVGEQTWTKLLGVG